jgi:hypothetical protein
MLVDYGKELRQFMSQTSLKKILNFGDVQFFADATIYVCIFVSQKSGDKMPVLACSLNSKNYHGEFEKEVKAATFEFPTENFGASEWSIRNKLHDSVLQKMNVGTALKDMPITINYGIKTGFNDAFIIDEKTRDSLISENPKSAELIVPVVRGRDIKAYEAPRKENAEFLILALYGSYKYLESKYPAIYNRLIQFKEKLQSRGQCRGSKAREDKPYLGAHHWLELDNCPTEDYIALFAKPKIMYPNMTSVFPFYFDETGVFGNDKTFIITAVDESFSLKALVAIFNSNLVKLWIWYNCPELMGGTREIRKAYFENLRIPLDNAELLQRLATLADEIIRLKKESDEANQKQIADLEIQVNTLVYQLYGITDAEEIEAVEKR